MKKSEIYVVIAGKYLDLPQRNKTAVKCEEFFSSPPFLLTLSSLLPIFDHPRGTCLLAQLLNLPA